MLPFATNMGPHIQTGLGLQPSAFNFTAVTSPINSSMAAQNAQAAQQTQNPPVSPPVVTGILPGGNVTAAPVMLVPDNSIMGISPLGWGAILVGAFVAYKVFLAPKA